MVLRSLGEHQRARQIQHDTLTRLHDVLGADHPDTLTSGHNLAADLREPREPETMQNLPNFSCQVTSFRSSRARRDRQQDRVWGR